MCSVSARQMEFREFNSLERIHFTRKISLVWLTVMALEGPGFGTGGSPRRVSVGAMARKPLTSEQQARITQVDGKVVRARPSDQEMHERRLFVRQLHAAGMHTSEIIAQATSPQLQEDGSFRAKFDCRPDAIRTILSEIREEQKREQELFAPTDRAAALARMYGDLVRLRSELGQMRNLAQKDWSAIRGHATEIRHQEKLIAEMEGTLKPQKVEHTLNMSDALVRAMSGMTAEQQEAAIREEQQRMRDASSITTSAEPAHALPAKPTQIPALVGRGPGQAVHAPRPPDRVGSPAQTGPPPAAATRRERDSDRAARRDGGANQDADVDHRPRPVISGARVVS